MKTGKKLLTGTLLALCAALLVLCSVLAIGWSKAAKTDAALPEVRNNGTAIQWKYSDETDWHDLVALDELRGAAGEAGKDGINGSDGRDGKDGVGISAVTVDKDGNITVTFTDGSTHKAGSIPVSKEEVQALKTLAGAAAGVAGVSLAGLLAGMGCILLKRKKQV